MSHPSPQLRYRDPLLPVDDRVEDLLGRMTLDEKVAQLSGTWLTSLVRNGVVDAVHVLATIPNGTGHVTRIGASTGLRPHASAELMNAIQRTVVEGTRLGIPVVVHEESTAGYCARDATVFPQAIGLGATWDEELVGEVASVIRRQMLAVGARHTLAPVLDVARDARWGRVEETYGEDPYLVGRLGTAYVRAIQNAEAGGLRTGVIATAKHFLGYAASEGGLNHGPVQIGPRELREVHAEPFAAAIRDGGLASVMNSYAAIDGVPCAGSAAILTALLRDELGFGGVVVADYFSVALLIAHHKVASTPSEAAARALTAGLDLELPATDCYGAPLRSAVIDGDVAIAVVDQACRRVLRSKFDLGLFEHPYVDAGIAAAAFDTPADRVLARRAASASMVLIRNESGVLPFAPHVRSIAVIGPCADDVRLLQGDYHYPAHVELAMGQGAPHVDSDGESSNRDDPATTNFLPTAGGVMSPGLYFTDHVTPLSGIRHAAAARNVHVMHAAGCGILAAPDDDEQIAQAVTVAGRCDIAVLCVGGRSGLTLESTVGEARDASDLRLTGQQEELVRRCAETGTPVVVVVVSGRVHALADVIEHSAAMLLAWCPGEEGGHGLADVLFGVCEPGGRLPITLPFVTGQVPIHHGVRQGGGRSMFHGTYADGPVRPLAPFGFGLTWTSFDFETLDVLSSSTTADAVVLRGTVRNTGDRRGTTVAQLYATDEVASVARHRQVLVGFLLVALDPGERRSVTFVVHPSRLAFFDESMRFVCEPGAFRFMFGASSADTATRATVVLGGGVEEYRQRDIVATASTLD